MVEVSILGLNAACLSRAVRSQSERNVEGFIAVSWLVLVNSHLVLGFRQIMG